MMKSTNSDNTRLVFLANAGMLIEGAGRRILVDALQEGANPGIHFDGLPDDLAVAMGMASHAAGNENRKDTDPLFRNVDALCFTHEHKDHFSESLVDRYLKNNTVSHIVMPKPQSEELMTRMHFPSGLCTYVDGEGENKRTELDFGEFRIKTISCAHYSRKRLGAPHILLLIELGRKRILFTGDADPASFTLQKLLNEQQEDERLDAIIFGPMFFHAQEGKNFIQGMGARKAILNHLPFRETEPTYHELIWKEAEPYCGRFSMEICESKLQSFFL